MRWVQAEYALKGLFLGLMLYTALQIQVELKPSIEVVAGQEPQHQEPQQPPQEQTFLDNVSGDVAKYVQHTRQQIVTETPWEKTGRIALFMLAGLGAGLLLGMLRQIRDLVRIFKKPHAFILFLLLENPLLIYIGLIGGLVVGAVVLFQTGAANDSNTPNIFFLSIIGAILGFGYSQLQDIKDTRYRLGVSIAVGAGVVYALVFWLTKFNDGLFLKDPANQMVGFDILLGLPFYYLLCFVGIAEESEAEIAGLCTMLGFALYLLLPETILAVVVVVPLAIYYGYATYVLPRLRVFKHTVRGYAYMEVGKLHPALHSFRRALVLDPDNQLAHQGMDALHSSIELDRVDAATLGLLDPSRCIGMVRKLLLQAPPSDQARKAVHLLNFVEKSWPKMISQVQYFRAVLAVHSHDLDRASELLSDLLNPEGWFRDDSARKAILFEAWQLVLLVHPVLKQRVGDPQLAQPGRRMEAIGAFERQLAQQPDEPAVLEFRKALYAGLHEGEFAEAAKAGPPADFSYRYAEEVGMTLVSTPDQWQRGAQYLRMAAFGQPLRQPSLYQQLAEAYGKAGDNAESARYRKLVRDKGLEAGLQNLPPDQRTIYFTTVKKLADEAAAQKDYDEAIYDYSLYTQYEGSGKETRRALAEMHEGKQMIFEALRFTETGLVYDNTDADLLKKKDKYYFNLAPDVLAKMNQEDERVRKYFDVDYCMNKAKSLLDERNTELEVLDWADHLVQLALVMKPNNLIAMVQKARIHLRRGERNEGLKILEDIRELKPSGSDESNAWYFVHKQLGKLYLEELNRPDLAIPALEEYLNHVGSGGDTLYDLGRAYEATGDKANAIKYYRMVTAYEGHPLHWDAEQAIRRLKDG